ncbi:MAG: hypothetical protein V1725_07135 [archaeon]
MLPYLRVITIDKQHSDVYGHVNNSHYPSFFSVPQSWLGVDPKHRLAVYKQTIDYVKELLPGQRVTVLSKPAFTSRHIILDQVLANEKETYAKAQTLLCRKEKRETKENTIPFHTIPFYCEAMRENLQTSAGFKDETLLKHNLQLVVVRAVYDILGEVAGKIGIEGRIFPYRGGARLSMMHEVYDEHDVVACCITEHAFRDATTRKPIRPPEWIKYVLA